MFGEPRAEAVRSQQVEHPVGGIFEQHILLEAAARWQWVTSFSCFCPAKSEVGGGGAVKSTRSGGKSQISAVRRVIPRKSG